MPDGPDAQRDTTDQKQDSHADNTRRMRRPIEDRDAASHEKASDATAEDQNPSSDNGPAVNRLSL